MADQVAVLRAGTVQQVGTPTEIYDHPANRWVGDVRRLAAHEPARRARPTGSSPANGWTPAEPRLRRRRRPPGAARRALGGPVARRPRRVGVAGRHGLRRRAARRPHARRHRDRRPARSSSRRRRRRRCASASSVRASVDLDRVHLFDADDGGGDRTAMIDATAPPGLRRARILERIQRDGSVSLAELATEHAVSPVTVHRDLELLSGEGLLERVRGGARSLPDAPAADRDGLERAPARGGAGEGRDRRRARASWSRTGRRSSSTPPRQAWRSRTRIELRPPADLTLVTNSPAIALGLTADVDPRDRRRRASSTSTCAC